MYYVQNNDFLSPLQEKQMSTQPDFILEYAHYLGDHFSKDGHKNIQVFVESYVGLNGRLSKLYIDPKVDLYQEKETFKHKNWIGYSQDRKVRLRPVRLRPICSTIPLPRSTIL